jgi:hypothetical protein
MFLYHLLQLHSCTDDILRLLCTIWILPVSWDALQGGSSVEVLLSKIQFNFLEKVRKYLRLTAARGEVDGGLAEDIHSIRDHTVHMQPPHHLQVPVIRGEVIQGVPLGPAGEDRAAPVKEQLQCRDTAVAGGNLHPVSEYAVNAESKRERLSYWKSNNETKNNRD